MIRKIVTALFGAALSVCALAQNPYLPMWEFIPDGEPYVFEDPDRPGEYRVYIYGSHDSLVSEYCGLEQVVWSAPVTDLSAWRYDGVIFESVRDGNGNLLRPDGKGDVLYAPDVALKTAPDGSKKYYFYPNNQAWGRNGMVAVSDRPDGPFKVCNWDPADPAVTDGVLRFDPAVFVDDDGRVYGYWGFGESWMAELDPETMATVKAGCEPLHNVVSGQNDDGVFHFFEASSMRKIGGKYVLIYSRMMPEGEFGMPQCNYNLAYAYSDNPLGPFTYGGTIIDARARDVDAHGNSVATANPYGNTHGSLCQAGGQWWVFYHRQTGTDEYSRQAMVAPVTMEIEDCPGGRVTIREAEYTSEGFRTEGLDPLERCEAGWACYLTNPDGVGQDYPHFIFSGSYVQPVRPDPETGELPEFCCPVVNNTAGSVVGYKYFNLDRLSGAEHVNLVMNLVPKGVRGRIVVIAGGPTRAKGGRRVGCIRLGGGDVSRMGSDADLQLRASVDGLTALSGKQPVYFVFKSSRKGVSLCDLHNFCFEVE